MILTLHNFPWILSILLIISCTSRQEQSSDRPPSTLAAPLIHPIDTVTGYRLNPVSGDSIYARVNSLGDTVITGKRILIKGKSIDPGTTLPPLTRRLPPPANIVQAVPYRQKAPSNPVRIPVRENQLKKIRLGEGPAHVTINTTGDTIQTGMVASVKQRTETPPGPEVVRAGQPGVKDNAVGDMRFLDVDQGMISSYIMAICTDSRGNIWFGTQGNGVARYDGMSYTIFTEENGLPSGRIWSIIEDRQGNIWFGSDGAGAAKYDGQSFTYFTENEGLSSNNIRYMTEDSKGNIWIGTVRGGACKYDGTSFTHYSIQEGMSDFTVLSILEDVNGDMWFATYSGGVCRFDGATFTHYTQDDGLVQNRIWCMTRDSKGNMWFGSQGNGVSVFDGESFINYRKDDGIPDNIMFCIREDSHGNMWLGGNEGGVGIFDGNYFYRIGTEQGLTSNIVWSLGEDSHGNMWIGSIAGGVNIIDFNSFSHFTSQDGIPGNIVLRLLEDSKGTIWLATDVGGITKYDGQNFISYTTDQGFPPSAIVAAFEDSKGNIWLGTYGDGVVVVDESAITIYTEEQGLNSNAVSDFAEDADGNIWIATTYGGIAMFDGKTFTHFSEEQGLPSSSVHSVNIGKDGVIWLGNSGGGVSRIDGDYLINYSEKEGLASNRVWDAIPDPLGRLWVATDDAGLCILDDDTVITYNTSHGLMSDQIWSIINDAEGTAWLGTNDGVAKLVSLTPGEYDIYNLRAMPFTSIDGLKSSDMFKQSAVAASDSTLWWGGGKSLERLNINNFRTSSRPPAPALRRIDINEQRFDFRNLADSIASSIEFDSIPDFENYPGRSVLPFKLNHLTFYFSAIDWAAPGKIRFSYRVKGLDNNWSVPGTEIKADYRNIPHGEYTFQVSAIGESQDWSEPFELGFTISPPWWQTWWARLGYIAMGVIGVIGIVRWRTATLKARAKKLEEEVDKATVVIRKQKEQVEEEKKRSDELLLNILPAEVAEELKIKGTADAKHFDDVTVLFTDFKGFTQLAEQLSAAELVEEIDTCFRAFDHIMEKYQVEKIKTIGDAYMAAGGVPVPKSASASDVVMAALDIRDFMLNRMLGRVANNQAAFEVRLGVHTGPIVAGIVGVKKFQYDIWGDTVNTASRMESAGKTGEVNISEYTYNLVKDNPAFTFIQRGMVDIKGKGDMIMYFVDRGGS